MFKSIQAWWFVYEQAKWALKQLIKYVLYTSNTICGLEGLSCFFGFAFKNGKLQQFVHYPSKQGIKKRKKHFWEERDMLAALETNKP